MKKKHLLFQNTNIEKTSDLNFCGIKHNFETKIINSFKKLFFFNNISTHESKISLYNYYINMHTRNAIHTYVRLNVQIYVYLYILLLPRAVALD